MRHFMVYFVIYPFQIAGVCAAKSVPLIIVHTYGFMGYLRLSLHEHHVVEAHPDHPRSDMRVRPHTRLARSHAVVAAQPVKS
jgi:hypothetical protein